MKKYMKLIRIKHWVKNGLIFLPIFCAKELSSGSLLKTLIAFIAFSLMASAIYIINDIMDVEKDRNHPRKCKRPIASGEISIKKATIVAIALIAVSILVNSLVIGSVFNPSSYLLVMYLLINIAYSCGAKDIPILDVVILSTGFILRVYYGAFVNNIFVSNWLFLTVLSASLFLGFGKRKKELKIKDEVRPVLKNYTEKFLDNFINISLCLVIVFYSLWVIEQNIPYLFLSIPMLIVIFMEYMMFMEKGDEGDPITILFQHKSLMLISIIYVFIMAFLFFKV